MKRYSSKWRETTSGLRVHCKGCGEKKERMDGRRYWWEGKGRAVASRMLSFERKTHGEGYCLLSGMSEGT